MLRKISDVSISRVQGVTTNSSSMVIYGLGDCYYQEACDSLAHSYDTYNYINGSGKWNSTLYDAEIRGELTDGSFLYDYYCKATLTNLIMLNYKLALQNLPIIPLIFIIGYNGKDLKSNKDVTRKIDVGNHYGITGKELRRCYKIYSEFNGKFKFIAESTFKFVSLEQDKNDVSLFHFQPLESIFSNPQWAESLQAYQNMKRKWSGSTKTKSNWRATLFKKASEIELSLKDEKLITDSRPSLDL